MNLQYRPDIDGLRALAVLAVLFYHTAIPGFSGGFVGVDVFFVISGFLITTIILKDLREERFSIARFYERRVRRIFPALFPVIAFSLIIGAYLFDAKAFEDLGQSIMATTLFSSNILFWRESGYFDAPSLQKPLLHTWSLAVEEQFYIFFPLLLALIHRYLNGRYLQWLVAAFLLSLLASVYGVHHAQSMTFYFVTTRAWELLAGAVLALGVIPVPSSAWRRNLLSMSGLGLIVYSMVFYSEETLFPGAGAIPPVMGAAFIIHSGGQKGGVVGRLLSLRPLVFIGLISYSLYLWHWPLVAFARFLMFRSMTPYEGIAIVMSSILIATLSWKYIEQPFRGARPLFPERKRLFAAAGAVMAVASGIGGVIFLQEGMGWRIERLSPGLRATLAEVQYDPVWKRHVEWDVNVKTIDTEKEPPVVGAPNALPSFALVGDSHARAIIPALEHQALSNLLSGHVITKASTPFLLGVSNVAFKADDGFDEVAFNDSVLAFLSSRPSLKTVFIAARWGGYVNGRWVERSEDPQSDTLIDSYGQYAAGRPNAVILRAGLERAVHALLAMERNVVLISDVPEIGYDVPRFFNLKTRFPALVSGFEISPTLADYNRRQHEAQEILEDLVKLPGVTLIHPEKRMFNREGKGRIVSAGKLLYQDDDHLSTAGALFVAPVFDEVFTAMAAVQSRSDEKVVSGPGRPHESR
jgi:peptidoglycan/LPS O-acetylase OafA/YrhL